MPRETSAPPTVRGFALPPADALPAPETANYFHFAWSGGTDVQLTLGFVDLGDIATQKPEPIYIGVTHRFLLTVRGFATLRAQVENAAQSLIAQGVPINEMMMVAVPPEK